MLSQKYSRLEFGIWTVDEYVMESQILFTCDGYVRCNSHLPRLSANIAQKIGTEELT